MIVQTASSYVNGSGSNAAKPYQLNIPSTGDGTEFKTLINICPEWVKKTATLWTMPTVTTQLSITGTSEQTSKGVRRVLVKVEMPYTSFTEGSDGKFALDRSKSGDPITAHIVITLPKQWGEDFAATGKLQESAVIQMLFVRTLLASLTRLPGETLLGTDGIGAVFPDDHSESAPYGAAAVNITNYSSSVSGSDQLYFSATGRTADTSSALLDTLGTTDVFVRGASLLKPFIDNQSYGIEF